MSSLSPPVYWIDSQQQFIEAIDRWHSSPFLAIDTEFERRTTYFPILALLQIYDGDAVYLIDPLAVECTDSFRQLCADESKVKILHSAKEDIEVLFHSWHCPIKNLFDTQVAYAFTQGTISIGYAAIVNELCQQEVSKEETQSDWLKRPLTQDQQAYAANDVIFLPKLYQILSKQITEQPFSDWFVAECQELCELIEQQLLDDEDYRQAKEVWRLNGTQLALFKLLYNWRETTAIKENRTKNHIAKDPQLVQLAIVMPKNKNDFYKIQGLHPKSVRLYGEAILQIVNSFLQKDGQTQSIVPNPRNIEHFNQLSSALANVVEQFAKRHQIATPVLASKRMIRKLTFAFLAKEKLPSGWTGWRASVLMPLFQPVLAEFQLA
ncbi:ribonuclease D [Aliikangiella maris]|uniref:HRDC domain-containing protein n=2 Tax=Aliikangiella maris TaxID=3162458 RepID=A0ABV3MKD1_9GAMM